MTLNRQVLRMNVLTCDMNLHEYHFWSLNSTNRMCDLCWLYSGLKSSPGQLGKSVLTSLMLHVWSFHTRPYVWVIGLTGLMTCCAFFLFSQLWCLYLTAQGHENKHLLLSVTLPLSFSPSHFTCILSPSLSLFSMHLPFPLVWTVFS